MKNELHEIILNKSKPNRTKIILMVSVLVSIFLLLVFLITLIKPTNEYAYMSPFEVRAALVEVRAERRENDRQIADALRYYAKTGDRSKLEDLVRDRTKD